MDSVSSCEYFDESLDLLVREFIFADGRRERWGAFPMGWFKI